MAVKAAKASGITNGSL